MKIYRISGVDEFMDSMQSYDIRSMPPQDQLNDDQKKMIRKKTLDISNSYTRLQYFLKYPDYAYFSEYDLSACNGYSNANEEALKQAMDLLVERQKFSYGVPANMPDWFYNKIIENLDKVGINGVGAGEILLTPDQYPQYFVKVIAEKFSDIAESMFKTSLDDRKQLVVDYLEFPTQNTFASLNGSANTNEMDISNPEHYKLREPQQRQLSFDITRYLSNSASYKSKVDSIRRGDNFRGNNWSEDSTTMYEDLLKVKEFYDNNKEFLDEYNPFSLVIDNSKEFGLIKTLFLSSKPIKISVVDNALNIIGDTVESYSEIWWKDNPRQELLEREYENVPESMPNSIYVFNENYEYHDIANGGSEVASPSEVATLYDDNYIDHLSRAARITVKEEADLFNEWIQEKTSTGEIDDHTYMEIIETNYVKEMTEKAGSDMYSIKVQSNTLLDEGDYDPNAKTNWNMVWPFKIQSAIDFWGRVPMRVRSAVSTGNKISSWFLYLSGLFPCDKILENAKKSIYDLKKVVDYIECAGDSEALRKVAKEILESKEKEVRKEVKERLPQFLESDAVKKSKISDFPEVYEYAVKFLKNNAGSEEMYSDGGQIPKWEYAVKQLNDVNIFFIDAGKYKSLLGEEGMKYFPATPDEANGFFAPKYSEFGQAATIVIFTDQTQTLSPEMVLKELGIDASSSGITFSEENTLWHEISHAFMDQVVHGRGVEIESESQWLTSPQEIAAMTYGNLQHVKLRIQQYFESIFPLPDRITQGLIGQVKSDIIDTFSWEFKGMSKQEALATMEESMPEFDEDALDVINNLSSEDQIKMMTNMFTEFFMRKYMRSKVEDQLQSQLSDIGKKVDDVDFGDEPIVPEKYETVGITDTDKFIPELEGRPDYQKFLSDCQEIIKRAHNYYDPQRYMQEFKWYVHKTDPTVLMKPFKIEDLLSLMFKGSSTLYDVNLNSLNPLFEEAIPKSLLDDVVNMVTRERDLKGAEQPIEQSQTPVTPDEAEDAGQFITDMEGEYGADWMWVAKNENNRTIIGSRNNWYRVSKAFHIDAKYVCEN